MSDRKPKLAVFKFASCDGCQLSLLDCETELLELAAVAEISYFLEASSRALPGPYDIALADGSITTEEDVRRIQEIRKQSKILVSIGACAVAGGIQALRNYTSVEEYARYVYPKPEYIRSLETSTPMSKHVEVDFELNGCPVNKNQLLEVVAAFLQGRRPNVAPYSQCVDCKIKGNICVMVAHGVPCLGPITHSGCGVLCPSFNRGCYSCFGPKETPNAPSLGNWFIQEMHVKPETVERALRSYYSGSDLMKTASEEFGAARQKFGLSPTPLHPKNE
ncbi:MAG: oxidoreductase [Bdellovibrionales bacterium RIFOXYC1_FULL_54_43]|nr:MAG: oxidoreductase [Bdellovibrionales bacterium RIFOXYC1_FULL_54_43]OFZ81461.1 MAG: oxidoreductase [Bdellovibrionales bacterium RIFOXYD1_FULL_55_31]